MSKRAAMSELNRKGIDREISEQVLDEIEVDYQEQIIEFLSKKYKNLEDEKIKRRAVAALQRLGYGWDDIKRAINSFEE